MSNERVAEVLEKAADLYQSETVDWCQGSYVSTRGGVISVCATQALIMACGGTVHLMDNNMATRDLDETDHLLVGEVLGSLNIGRSSEGLMGEYPLIEWNDDVIGGRTKQDVIDLFKNRAKELRNQA